MPRPVVPILRSPSANSRATVEGQVPRHHELRAIGHDEVVPAHIVTARSEVIDLGEEHLGIDDDAVGDDADLAGPEDPRRHQVQAVRLAAEHHRVPGIAPALIAHDQVGLVGEEIDDARLALVTSLSADHADSRHRGCPGLRLRGMDGAP